MTRIIAGRAGSLPLEVPPAGTRPTSDRVRESLFGALESAGLVHGAAVLDLYAGSGALGLEALSRGAAQVDLVESAPRAARVAERNAERVARAAGAPARVHRMPVAAYLAAPRGPFDLVLADPPYDLGDDEVATVLAAALPSLAGAATVVLERSARASGPASVDGLEAVRERRYGDTVLRWFRAPEPVDQASV